MRVPGYLALAFLAPIISNGVHADHGIELERRQNASGGDLPSLTSTVFGQPTPTPTAVASSTTDASTMTSTSATPGPTSNTDEESRTSSQSSSSPTPSAATTSAAPPSTSAAAPTGASANDTSTTPGQHDQDLLPLEPRITPTFGIAGVLLMCLGAIYALVGVKTRWIQIFLSSAFLAGIATTALVDYVMNPPVSNAIQGGFFVAIFMTGAVFGGGALIFKEFTEGLACLLGGFCFSMWLLTLRPGGLITSAVGKGTFIGIFCALAWAVSWSHYTRPYGLIGSTAFSGATAFVLGLDCFTRSGLKEFWFYIWDLNDDLFPLHTDTYPLTRGMRVEIAVVVIGTIIGILSQIKLWKVIRSRQKEEAAVEEEDARKTEAMEAALGRHLQRQNDREKSEWERQYGNRLQSKRSTVLWQDAHPEKRYSTVSVVAVQPSPMNSTESLEMNAFGPYRSSIPQVSKMKHQSSVTVNAIPEEEEGDDGTSSAGPAAAAAERQKALNALEQRRISAVPSSSSKSGDTLPERLADRFPDPQAATTAVSSEPSPGIGRPRHPGSAPIKRGSLYEVSDSQEHLLAVERPYSRASSAAATLDEENEDLNIDTLQCDFDSQNSPVPEIVISPAPSEDQGGAEPRAEDAAGQDVNSSPSKSPESDPVHGGDGPTAPHDPSLASITMNNATVNSADNAVPRPTEGPRSQNSDSASSSVDSLTQTALAQLPSQLSNVILSYRTNEWAKHISTAEIPLYDEPASIEDDAELPVQLASPTSESDTVQPTQESVVSPPPPPPPAPPVVRDFTPTVKSGDRGVGVAGFAAAPVRSASFPEPRRVSTSVATAPAPTPIQPPKPSAKKTSRHSFNPGSTTSLVATAIDENVPTDFTTSQSKIRRMSGPSPYSTPQRSSSASALNLGSTRPATQQSNRSPPSASVLDLRQLSRPTSQHSLPSGVVLGTRLGSYESRQPAKRDERNDAERRESLMTDWRLQQQQWVARTGLRAASAGETGRAMMQMERENQKLQEEYERNERQRKQHAMDQVMRRPDMQDLHREALRKMQATANKKLGG